MKYKTWDSTLQSLRRENANLKEQVEEERKRNKVSESVKLYSVFSERKRNKVSEAAKLYSVFSERKRNKLSEAAKLYSVFYISII